MCRTLKSFLYRCQLNDNLIVFGPSKLHLKKRILSLNGLIGILAKQVKQDKELIRLLKRFNKPTYFLKSDVTFNLTMLRTLKSNLKIARREYWSGPDVRNILNELSETKDFNVFFLDGFLNVVSVDGRSVYKFVALERKVLTCPIRNY